MVMLIKRGANSWRLSVRSRRSRRSIRGEAEKESGKSRSEERKILLEKIGRQVVTDEAVG